VVLKQDRRANAGREGTPVPSTVAPDLSAVLSLPADGGSSSLIDLIVREGARRMLAAALQAEVDAYVEQFAGELDGNGRRLVVRNGTAVPRAVVTSSGAIEVTAPRVNDKRTDPVTGGRMRFSSAILPPWARKTPQVSEVLPLLYLHGLSSQDFLPALSQFLGTSAGLSHATITRLTEDWKAEAKAFMTRDLAGTDYVYVWADGIHVNIRLEETRLCLLVMIGVRIDGTKELIALADGYRESAGSWADLLRDCARRGMRAPVLAMGDGALGFWGALREVFPQTKEQRCWFHKIANVLDAMPKSAHPGAKKALQEIWNAENKTRARTAVKAFVQAYSAKFPKATAKIADSEEELLAFYDYPAEHWIHLRTTNPIESTFATVRLRTRVTKGPGSRAAGLAMAFKLVEAAQRRWRKVNAPELVALVRAGATFKDGHLVERSETDTRAEKTVVDESAEAA
jgi:transposase-like protein